MKGKKTECHHSGHPIKNAPQPILERRFSAKQPEAVIFNLEHHRT
jgi:hypothetical protein